METWSNVRYQAVKSPAPRCNHKIIICSPMEKLAHSGIPKRADLIGSIAQISDSSLCSKKNRSVFNVHKVRVNRVVTIVDLLNLIGSPI